MGLAEIHRVVFPRILAVAAAAAAVRNMDKLEAIEVLPPSCARLLVLPLVGDLAATLLAEEIGTCRLRVRAPFSYADTGEEQRGQSANAV